MLPGVRFLFAAVALAVSMLVFGLGAAALLRTAHEQFASARSIRPAQTTLAMRPVEPAMPTLSLLRVEPQVIEPRAQDEQPIAAKAVQATEPSLQAADLGASEAAGPALPDAIAALPRAEPERPETNEPHQRALPATEQIMTEQTMAKPVLAEQNRPQEAGQQVGPAALATQEAAAPAHVPETATKPEPAPSEAAAMEAEKPAAPATAIEQDPPHASTEIATPEPAKSEPVALDLPQVAALTGPIPTPKPDPRAPTKPAAQSFEQPAKPEAEAADQAAKPGGQESTGSIREPEPKAERPAATGPKAGKPAQAKVKRRRQVEGRRARPVANRPSTELSPFGLPPT
ncbi:hypothetical protein SR870_10105 [Rhodopseudomonas palustris]|uniref:hypothetical protein n=1 Tax=Rhodopseudomonas palustris TaxID=1076 RepID=UPI002ACD5DEE|nr:hypothetical protein [Rhodopseudomonas palustris]WQH01593.1 hypothetical protein SR870_10105 [Rhodopseudomonas palustris]